MSLRSSSQRRVTWTVFAVVAPMPDSVTSPNRSYIAGVRGGGGDWGVGDGGGSS